MQAFPLHCTLDDAGARPSFFVAASQGVLLAIVLGIYLGAMPYLILFSPQLLYGVYLLIIGAAATILFFEWSAVRSFRWVAPYIAWVLFYCYWGALVGPPEMPLGDVAKTCLKTILVIGGFALVVRGRRSLRQFASGVQVVALVNAGIAVWETSHPELIVKLARAHDPMATAFNVERPAGIWSNPDEASFAYLFALLVSCWGRGTLIWAGRAACCIGIFLTASRTGAYVLLFCSFLLLMGKIGRVRWRPGGVAAILFGLLGLCAGGVTLVKLAPPGTFDLSRNPQVMRVLDFSETDVRKNGEPGRTDIARAAAFQALEGPWYGSGIYTFQLEPKDRFAVLEVGAHNLYITVWGETGLLGGLSFLLLLTFGFSRLVRHSLAKEDRLRLTLLWLGYLVIALTWHNQLTSFAGMLYSGSLWHLPGVLDKRSNV